MTNKITTSAILLATSLPMLACSYAGAPRSGIQYGESVKHDQLVQIAYKDPSDRLRDLSIDFAAETQDTVTFAFDSSALDSSARQALRGQAKWLKEHPDVRMTITGHTDRVGSEAYNDGLGLRRARRVVSYLASQGISRSRLDAVESLGERNPVVETPDRERRNRRAITTVAGFERNFVGTGMDGEVAQRLYDVYQGGEVGVAEANSGG
ncbi:OmpA family protein [Rhodobacteraceae bacterium NNCM2]|nr:OmpA family protein [Coraliihabitans acroporae]